jgi:peptide subunit release factor 1 (eRF1)
MLQDIDIRQLADLSGPERSFVSLYLSGPDALGSLADREQKICGLLAGEEVEREHFERTMEMIRSWIDEHPGADDQGRCVFGCWALEMVQGFDVPAPMPDRLWIGAGPYLRPLAELQDEYETFVVVAADSKASRIFLVTAEETELADRVRGDVKNKVKKGGWSQQRYARRRDKQLQHYAQEIVDALEELRREEDFRRIVLLGSEETMQEIVEAAPEPLAALIVAEKAIDLREGEEVLIDEAYTLYFEEERAAEQRLWERIRDEYFSHGRAVLGPTDVLKAALVGRVETAVILRDAKIAGTRCRDCENVVHGTPDTCQVCGSSSVFQVDLVNTVVRALEASSAEADFVDPLPGLDDAGGLAALLRY